MYNNMIEKVKEKKYRHEGTKSDKSSSFFDVIFQILTDFWTKNDTPPY